MIEHQDLDELYVRAIKECMLHGRKSSPRGIETLELLSPLLVLRGPQDSLPMVKNRARNLNYAFQVIESLQYLDQCMDPDRICHYNTKFGSFKNWTTGEFDGAYGPRLKWQMGWCHDLLLRDPDTRQAVMTIFHSGQDHHEWPFQSLDVPCTLTIQFLLRDNLLHCIVNMRSNDLLWGTPYDIMGFTLLQHAMASWLGVRAGDYFHHAGSLHLYGNTREHLDKALDWKGEKVTLEYGPFNIKKTETTPMLKVFWDMEKRTRLEGFNITKITVPEFPECLAKMFHVVNRFNVRRRGKPIATDR